MKFFRIFKIVSIIFKINSLLSERTHYCVGLHVGRLLGYHLSCMTPFFDSIALQMYKLSLEVSQPTSGTTMKLNFEDIPTVGPLLAGIFKELHRLGVEGVPKEIPAAFRSQVVNSFTSTSNASPPALVTSSSPPSPGRLVRSPKAKSLPVKGTHASKKKSLKAKSLKICPVCEVPQSGTNLSRHLRTHQPVGSNKFKCSHPCKASFPRSDQLAQHQAGGLCARFGHSY